MADGEPKPDLYNLYLGIPSDEQPADYYRLLDVRRYESDRDVIQTGYDRRMAYLSQIHDEEVEDLNTLLAKANICLLDPQKKQAYDDHLKAADKDASDRVSALREEEQARKSEVARLAEQVKHLEKEASEHTWENLSDRQKLKAAREALTRISALREEEEQASARLRFWVMTCSVSALTTIVFGGLLLFVSSLLFAPSKGESEVAEAEIVIAETNTPSEAETNTRSEKADPGPSSVAQSPTEITTSIGIKLRLIPAGEFLMGNPDTDADSREKPYHRVQITKPFYLAVYEVTQEEYEQLVAGPPPDRTHARHPVEQVSWNWAVEFCNKLSQKEGRQPYYRVDGQSVSIDGGNGYRLPTEAEWEYACRAESTTRYSFGDDDNQLGDYAWCDENSNLRTHPVGQKQPNAWGLYDMHGNVEEFCWDRFSSTYYGQSPEEDPLGPSTDAFLRTTRGGSCRSQPQYCRSAFRGSGEFLDIDIGFRVACDAAPFTQF